MARSGYVNAKNMNYELAKKLKDAGFPQAVHRNVFCGKSACGPENRLCAYAPTLSELIEACVNIEKDFALRRRDDGTWSASDEYWDVDDQMNSFVYEEYGEIPEDAVANLWLKLQCKQ